ncbi:polysaccharide deacetylase family protein [Streptomyces spiramenti]|uniref:Polysaccharide deacetylase family protein n=1 Tax=Streptomyces spiramenti TaxID=2720606 RepID=A0ABX1AIV6_9ACTN|nr:polysaccharide deacetylase family protein [Streptomyces spiramenti]
MTGRTGATPGTNGGEAAAGPLRARLAQTAWSLVRRTESLRPGGRAGSPLFAGGPVFRLPAAPGGSAHAPEVALTVDDGPDPRWTPRLLDVLDTHDVRATFFVIGERAARHPELLRRIRAAGHTLGNHSHSHPQPFAALPPEAIESELAATQRAVVDATGEPPQLFRAPAGGWSRRVLETARGQGLTPVDWSVDPKDWRSPPPGRIARVVLGARHGDIVLCHDGGGDRSGTVAALDAALGRLRHRGVAFRVL